MHCSDVSNKEQKFSAAEPTVSVHQPHDSETWMHSPHDCALALMQTLPSGTKQKFLLEPTENVFFPLFLQAPTENLQDLNDAERFLV